ncbi:serine/threonine-protein kinase haspin homolog [Abrus precatorius]|uniref:non-specific serine/threonine protein kinase n=1 Tax=Abrus precatorius TaxID=3816 RepID=A0A8B8L488_ABRPR|nr:serine/threonine-protein kinase haspin homolog [Abrus precatorius]
MNPSAGSNSKALKATEITLPHCSSSNSNAPPPTTSGDLWSELFAAETHHHQQIQVVYHRRNLRNNHNDSNSTASDSSRPRLCRVSLADPNKRVSWNRSLSTRGRTSIAVGACLVYQPQLKQDKRKGKPALPKGKFVQPPNFEKERLYFQEVDAFELLEESPSPKKVGTWNSGNMAEEGPIPAPCSRLEKWLHSRTLNPISGPSSTLSKILDTPATTLGTIHDIDLNSLDLRTLERTELKSLLHTVKTGDKKSLINDSLIKNEINLHTNDKKLFAHNEGYEEIEDAVRKLSLASTSSLVDGDHINPFSALLEICGQSVPSTLRDMFSRYWEGIFSFYSGSETIVKVGEGTFGEAFKVNNYVCKIVPFDGDFRVNGEIQKRSEELLEEVLLCKILNQLRGKDGDSDNLCRAFIDCIEFRVCQGPYDATLIRAWEDWDLKHGSENDHPREFPDKQCYMVFVQEHGGKDLESFALLNFDEARTLLVQVTAGLAVAESAYEFEHRDLHWGNILISRSDSITLQFTLDGRTMLVKTYGLIISIIDFTLSRINTGNRILYLDLSSDPELFKGPKGDKQSETYRRMKDVTEDWWEGRYPKTNVLWLIYLVDILLTKKSFERSTKNERDLRSLKKRLDKYNSAKEALLDPFFTDLFVESEPKA